MPLPWFDVTGPDDAPTVVLLHAFPLSSDIYDRLVPHLSIGDVRVVRIDLPGLGRSAAAARGEPSVAAMADAVVSVLDHVGPVGSPVVVLGTSTGGYVALALLARHPARVAAVVLASTTTLVIEPDVPAERRGLADDLDATGDLTSLVEGADAGLGATARREQPDLLPLLRDLVRASDPAGVAWAARAVAERRDTTADLAAYDGAVVLLFGAEDTETPPVRATEMAAARGGRPTRTVVLPATGHLTALERPAEVAEVVLDLVRSLRLGRSG